MNNERTPLVIVLGRVEVQPENRDAFITAARTVEAATRQEPGCINYAFAQDLSDENLFWLSEGWIDGESLAAHGQTTHIAQFRAAIAAIPFRRFLVKRYDAGGETILASR